MFDFWESDLGKEETDALLDKAAEAIRKRGMETPAIMALEMHKPLANVGANAAVVFAPFMVPFFGFDGFEKFTQIIRRQENIEGLLHRLEAPVTKHSAKEQAI